MAEPIATVSVDPARARVYEHGWQSWSPTYAARLGELPARPVSGARRVGNYRPDRDWPATVYAGEGLLAPRVRPDRGGLTDVGLLQGRDQAGEIGLRAAVFGGAEKVQDAHAGRPLAGPARRLKGAGAAPIPPRLPGWRSRASALRAG